MKVNKENTWTVNRILIHRNYYSVIDGFVTPNRDIHFVYYDKIINVRTGEHYDSHSSHRFNIDKFCKFYIDELPL